MLIKRMLSILLPYLLFLLALFIWQRNLIYFPGKYPLARQQELAERLNLELWPTTENYLGLISKSTMRGGKGTVIVFHGNAGSAINRGYYFNALERLGYRVIIAEYPGYGARSGAPSESVLISDGIAIATQARDDFGDPIFLWGESLGSGVVGGIVHSGQVPIKGIVLMTPFDSMANVAQHHYWLFLAKWLIRDRFDNLEYLKGYSGNTAMVIAEDDKIIPNRYSLNLYESLQYHKRLWSFENADHNSLPLASELAWWQEVMDFIDK